MIGAAEGAGFKFVTKSEVNPNPKGTKDYPKGVWTLPPTLRLGDGTLLTIGSRKTRGNASWQSENDKKARAAIFQHCERDVNQSRVDQGSHREAGLTLGSCQLALGGGW